MLDLNSNPMGNIGFIFVVSKSCGINLTYYVFVLNNYHINKIKTICGANLPIFFNIHHTFHYFFLGLNQGFPTKFIR